MDQTTENNILKQIEEAPSVWGVTKNFRINGNNYYYLEQSILAP